MKNTLLFLLLMCGFTVFGQADTLTAFQAKEHLNKEVVVRGKVVGARLFEKNGRKTYLVNLEIPFPNTPLTIVLFDEVYAAFSQKYKLESNSIIVKGIVTLYNDKFQIVLKDLKDLKIVQ